MSKAFEITPDNPALHTLVRLHADLGGRIQQNKAEASRLADEMRHVEAVIKLLNPDYDTRRIAVRRRVRANPWFERGDQYRCALDVLRRPQRPHAAANSEPIGRRAILSGQSPRQDDREAWRGHA
jgi:hypothetical protein